MATFLLVATLSIGAPAVLRAILAALIFIGETFPVATVLWSVTAITILMTFGSTETVPGVLATVGVKGANTRLAGAIGTARNTCRDTTGAVQTGKAVQTLTVAIPAIPATAVISAYLVFTGRNAALTTETYFLLTVAGTSTAAAIALATHSCLARGLAAGSSPTDGFFRFARADAATAIILTAIVSIAFRCAAGILETGLVFTTTTIFGAGEAGLLVLQHTRAIAAVVERETTATVVHTLTDTDAIPGSLAAEGVHFANAALAGTAIAHWLRLGDAPRSVHADQVIKASACTVATTSSATITAANQSLAVGNATFAAKADGVRVGARTLSHAAIILTLIVFAALGLTGRLTPN